MTLGNDRASATAEYVELWREWGLELSSVWRFASNRAVAPAPSIEPWAHLRVAFLAEGPAQVAEETQLLEKIVGAMGFNLGRDAGVWHVDIGSAWRDALPGTPAVVVVLGASLWSALSGRLEFEADRGRFHRLPGHPGLRLVPTWPPSHLLRHPEAKKIVWEDMKKVVRGLAESAC